MATHVSSENVEKTIYDGLVELGTERDDALPRGDAGGASTSTRSTSSSWPRSSRTSTASSCKGDDVKDVKTVGDVDRPGGARRRG